MKKIVFIFLSALIIFASCNTTKVEDSEKNVQTTGRKLQLNQIVQEKSWVEKSIKDFEPFIETNIKYPYFEKIPLLNNYIENSILNYYDSFYTMAKKDWEEMNHQRKDLNSSSSDLPPFDYIINFEVFENDKYISVLIDSYNFCGGAHGNTNLTSYTYSKENKDLEDIHQITNLSYIEISDLCREQLCQTLMNQEDVNFSEIKSMIFDGTEPFPSNFKTFTIDKKTVTIYFEPYAVAPYSYGIQKVIFKIK